MARRTLSLLLGLLMVASLSLPAATADPPTERSIDDALAFDFAWGALAPGVGTQRELDAGWRRYVEDQLNAVKRELRELEVSRRVALAEFSEPQDSCEREAVERTYRAEQQRLRENVRALRQIRGDKRGFLSKAWHRIGPSGRRILRAFGDESLEVLRSGGSLHGGVARRILFRIGRREITDTALRAVTRKVHGRSAKAVGAAVDECQEQPDGNEPAKNGKSDDTRPPAIPAGIYEGQFDEATILESAWSDIDTKVVTNAFELRVAEDGSISGRFAIEERGLAKPAKGSAVRCPGAGSRLEAKIKPGQVIGPTLPQPIKLSVDFTLWSTYLGNITPDEIEFFCISPEATVYREPYKARIISYGGDRLVGSAGDWRFELTRQAPDGSDEDAPWDREDA